MTSVDHFQALLNNAVQHLGDLCRKWEIILNEATVSKSCPEDVLAEIMSTLGKTNLLLTSKLPQFRGIIDQLSRGENNQRPVTLDDLRGFWDLVSIQITDVDNKFENLALRKSRDWEQLPAESSSGLPTPRRRPRPGNVSARKTRIESEMQLRNAARSRLALAKAKLQESVNSSGVKSEMNLHVEPHIPEDKSI